MIKDIIDYEGLYKIDEFGLIYSCRKYKIMKHNIDRHGYHRIGLVNRNGKKLYKGVHRLVAQTFIPNPDNKPQVNHKDSDKSNNCVYNLEWVTSSENNIHAYRYGNNCKRTGNNNVKSIKIIQYDLNFKIIKEWESMNICANNLKLREGDISKVCNDIRNTCGGYIFRKKEGDLSE